MGRACGGCTLEGSRRGNPMACILTCYRHSRTGQWGRWSLWSLQEGRSPCSGPLRQASHDTRRDNGSPPPCHCHPWGRVVWGVWRWHTSVLFLQIQYRVLRLPTTRGWAGEGPGSDPVISQVTGVNGSVLGSLVGDANLLEATSGSLHHLSAAWAAMGNPRCHSPGAAHLGTTSLKVVAKSRGQISGWMDPVCWMALHWRWTLTGDRCLGPGTRQVAISRCPAVV